MLPVWKEDWFQASGFEIYERHLQCPETMDLGVALIQPEKFGLEDAQEEHLSQNTSSCRFAMVNHLSWQRGKI